MTELDAAALLLVKRCGFVGVNADGCPYLEHEQRIGKRRVQRLVDLGLLGGAGDYLPLDEGARQQSQTLFPVEQTEGSP